MTTVRTLKELRLAVKNRDSKIRIEGKLAKKMKGLDKFDKNKVKKIDEKKVTATLMVGALVVDDALVALVIIAVLGLVTLYAISKNYDVEIKSNDLVELKLSNNK